MADPLGLIGGAGRVQPNPLQGPIQGQGLRSGAGQAGGAGAQSFKDALLKNIEQANKLQQEAATAAEDGVNGRRSDVESVLLATAKADNAFRVLLAVKNKVMAAYDEIKQVRV